MPLIRLNQLRENIVSAFNALTGNVLGKNPNNVDSVYYPEFEGVTTPIEDIKGNWRGQLQTAPYAFAVYDIVDSKFDSGQFSEFQLPLAPQQLNQDENFAIRTRATQGGIVVNHSGNKFKDLTIEGTTGLAPFRGMGGASAQTGDAIGQPDMLKFKSGFEVFHHLRNYFRAYYEAKKLGSFSKSSRLVFKNYKDGEFLLVEITKFSLKRSASKPHLYDYSIQMKVISPLNVNPEDVSNTFLNKDNQENIIANAVEIIQQGRGRILRGQEILRNVQSTVNADVIVPLQEIALGLKSLANLPVTAMDIAESTIKDTVDAATSALIISDASEVISTSQNSEILELGSFVTSSSSPTSSDVVALGPLLNELDLSRLSSTTLSQVDRDITRATEVTKSSYEEIRDSLRTLRKEAEDLFNAGSSDLDALFNRTSLTDPNNSVAITDAQFDVLKGLYDTRIGLDLVLTTNILFESPYQERVNEVITDFNGDISLNLETAAREVQYVSGLTLERIAQVELGDSTRWIEIAILNDLEYPYVGSYRPNGEKILTPGDRYLLPTQPINDFSLVPRGADNIFNVTQSELQRSFGIDLRVDDNFDLVIGNNGDLEVTYNIENVAQAIMLKLGYEKGELMRHPNLGVGLVIGGKLPNALEVRDQILTSLVQDPRIESVEDLNIFNRGNTYNISFYVKIKNVDIPIPIDLEFKE